MVESAQVFVTSDFSSGMISRLIKQPVVAGDFCEIASSRTGE
jgi:hypothetical protein